MRIPALLFILTILRPCGCGNDKEEEIKVYKRRPARVRIARVTPYPNKAVHSQPAVSRKGGLNIDISNPDERVIDVLETHGRKIRHKRYFSRPGLKVTSVRDDVKTLWEASDAEYCASMIIIFSCKYPPLLVLCLVDRGGRESKYFEKNDNEWESITFSEFKEKRENMNKKMTRQKARKRYFY
ncbi:signal peptide-containing protein [Theileria equi strain WA]|uniref:Signal peptide-containing protein n=1 Tax=Theileria equi strain WA TaxID=1537102 RepID=L0AXJ2_THEEQ|nr:signal peptide-containing protein [Theileria equi strain WA]AFZ79741.1 signal peptide-containing protein [Theileria equi strain WA]|eukprot:XP_004829407.1 signal peptide-containing protein [Theileria equi strain WA]